MAHPQAFTTGLPFVAVKIKRHAVAAIFVDVAVGVVHHGAGDTRRNSARHHRLGAGFWAKADVFRIWDGGEFYFITLVATRLAADTNNDRPLAERLRRVTVNFELLPRRQRRRGGEAM